MPRHARLHRRTSTRWPQASNGRPRANLMAQIIPTSKPPAGFSSKGLTAGIAIKPVAPQKSLQMMPRDSSIKPRTSDAMARPFQTKLRKRNNPFWSMGN